eukprot:scaffold125798_cov72-Phaeocystis_antarctica.AAC.2
MAMVTHLGRLPAASVGMRHGDAPCQQVHDAVCRREACAHHQRRLHTRGWQRRAPASESGPGSGPGPGPGSGSGSGRGGAKGWAKGRVSTLRTSAPPTAGLRPECPACGVCRTCPRLARETVRAAGRPRLRRRGPSTPRRHPRQISARARRSSHATAGSAWRRRSAQRPRGSTRPPAAAAAAHRPGRPPRRGPAMARWSEGSRRV